VKDREIDAILDQGARNPHVVDPALLDRIARSLGPSFPAVRPLPPSWVLAGGLMLICAAVGLTGAARLGLFGLHKMTGFECALIFPVLGGLLWLAAAARVAESVPGSRRRLSPGLVVAIASLGLLAVFAIVFRDYRTHSFVHQGIACLTAGLLHAVPAALAGWLLLRRGFAVNPAAAGLMAGALAGLAGVAMLELHCPNFEAPHVMLWHTAVVPVSAAAGAALGWLRALRQRFSTRG
jgi:hypothetical protein